MVRRGETLDEALRQHLGNVDGRDRALAAEIVQGSVRWYGLLVGIVKRLLTKPGGRLATDVEALLVSALYQIRDMRVPDHAAVSETVAAVALGKQQSARGFVNAVLRRYLRERAAIDADLTVAERRSHPAWLADAITRDWPDAAAEILDANNARAPMWLRINPRRTSVDEYCKRLAGDFPDVIARRFEPIPHAVCLDQPIAAADLPGFATGEVSIQDGGAQCAGHLLAPRPGERILDACAAPGNKTTQLAEIAGPEAQLVALDVAAARLTSLAANLERTGAVADIRAVDAADLDAWWDGRPFERILLDAPCSATGVIRRHPDIKFTRRADDLAPLGALQARLLDSLWSTLAPGGTLVYATCSVLRQENERIVQEFVDCHSDARNRRQLPASPIQALMTPAGPGFQLLPGRHRLDGFFYACLDKTT